MNVTKLKEMYNRLVNLHSEIDLLQQDLKAMKEEVEEALPKVSFTDLSAAAKLKAQNKLGEKVSKLNSFLELVESVG